MRAPILLRMLREDCSAYNCGRGDSLGVVRHELEIKNRVAGYAFIDDGTRNDVVEVVASFLGEQAYGGTLAGVNDDNTGLGNVGTVFLPHRIEGNEGLVGFSHLRKAQCVTCDV